MSSVAQSPRWLAAALEVDVALLVFAAERVDSYYRQFNRRKPNGELRKINRSIGDLQFIQRRIADVLLKPHRYPDAMHGCVKGRSPLTNAARHLVPECLVTLDIQSFYPSVSDRAVFGIWQEEFGFGSTIAALLTRLTTRDCQLPQGVATSGFLANLTIRRAVSRLDSSKIGRITFYVDDVGVSTSSPHEAIELVARALSADGFSIRRDKTRIMRKGYAQVLTGLNVDRQQPSVPRQKRDKVRAAIRELALRVRDGQESLTLSRSIIGRINHVAATNPRASDRLRRLMEAALEK